WLTIEIYDCVRCPDASMAHRTTEPGAVVSRYLVMLIAFVALAGVVPHYFELYAEGPGLSHSAARAGAHAGTAPAAVSRAGANLPEASYLGGGRVAVLRRDARGHYGGRFAFNGRPIEGMIDTGATFVALNQSTARDIGIELGAGDFTLVVE